MDSIGEDIASGAPPEDQPEAAVMKRFKYFSVQKWKNSRHIGIAVGWDSQDGTACLMLSFWRWTLALGPHT